MMSNTQGSLSDTIVSFSCAVHSLRQHYCVKFDEINVFIKQAFLLEVSVVPVVVVATLLLTEKKRVPSAPFIFVSKTTLALKLSGSSCNGVAIVAAITITGIVGVKLHKIENHING